VKRDKKREKERKTAGSFGLRVEGRGDKRRRGQEKSVKVTERENERAEERDEWDREGAKAEKRCRLFFRFLPRNIYTHVTGHVHGKGWIWWRTFLLERACLFISGLTESVRELIKYMVYVPMPLPVLPVGCYQSKGAVRLEQDRLSKERWQQQQKSKTTVRGEGRGA